MTPDLNTSTTTLQKRANELQKIARQMRADNLHNSAVYRNLDYELKSIRVKLNETITANHAEI